jgi:multidrug efflux system membrane fusion protein
MDKRMHLVVSLSLCMAVLACKAKPSTDPSAMPPPAVPVSAANATEEPVPMEIRAVGNVEPTISIEVKSQVTGPLTAVHFAEGANVQQGQLLFEIDARPYRDALRQAEAALARDEAQLHAGEANVARDRVQSLHAEQDAARYDQLLDEGIAPQNQQQQFRADANAAAEVVKGSAATVESMRALIDSDKAAVDNAKLDLSYCQIMAPVSGRAGNLLLHVGNLVKSSDTTLIVLNQIAPISVTFGVPERFLSDIRAKSRDRGLAVVASVANSTQAASKGVLAVIDNTVDSSTGTIRLKGSFDNKDGGLWPGQFVNVVMTLDTVQSTVMPQEAVQAGQQGSFVYVVRPDQTVEARPVTTGAVVNGMIVVESGVKAGESVVTDGQSRLYPGAKVKIQAAEPPSQAR